jgi:hypothetical protein
MNKKNIADLRLLNQHIAGLTFSSAEEVVGWMGAMQAQDLPMVKWAVGIRLPGSTAGTVESAMNKGKIIRTHLMRPTWHLVKAEDIYWMLDLTAPQIRQALRSRHKRLGLTGKAVSRSLTVAIAALEGGKNFSRKELIREFVKAGFPTTDNMMAHLLVNAELEGVICSGLIKGSEQTYTLLEEKVPNRKTLDREEALATLAKKYFLSHGPATLRDFAWWSGLLVKDAKQGLEMNKKGLKAETVDNETYWMPESNNITAQISNMTLLMPAYDEMIISYRNREIIINAQDQKRSISVNGIFRPTIMINGEVTGLWKKSVKNNRVLVEPELFRPHNQRELKSIAKASESVRNFYEEERF